MTIESAFLRKLDRPPAGPNWVRFVHEDIPTTTRAIVSFVAGRPRFTYGPGYTAGRDHIELGIDLETALKLVNTKGAPAGRGQNRAFIKAFFEYCSKNSIGGTNPIQFEPGLFRVSREIVVPVSPLSIVNRGGKFVPIFVCGWRHVQLSSLQRRLLMTVIEDAFLSLTDFQCSPADVLFFPADPADPERRRSEHWQRGDYKLLGAAELKDCIEIYLAAREAARPLVNELIKKAEDRAEEEATEIDHQPDLFRRDPDQ